MKYILVVLGILMMYCQKIYALYKDCDVSSGECLCQPGWWGSKCEHPLECLLPGDNGVHYRGTQNVTSDGIPCDPWDLANPRGGSFGIPPDGTHHNYCRHIATDSQQNTWCYTTLSSSKRFGTCNIPLCAPHKVCSNPSEECACQPGWWGRNCEYPVECLIPGDNGVHYRGTQNVTKDGIVCDRWDLANPRGGSFSIPPDGTHHNYCRHTATDTQQNTWCYTTQSSSERFGICNIPLCDTQCEPPKINEHIKIMARPRFGFEVNSKISFGCESGYALRCEPLECLILEDNGVHYRGTQNVTSDGTVCDRWDLQGYSFETPPDGPHHNYCRHIQGDSIQNAWCYIATKNPNKRWGTCSVTFCDPTLLSSTNLCQKGYYTDRTMTCTWTKIWSTKAPSCIVSCENPKTNNHSKIASTPKGQYVEDDVIEIECNQGYTTNDQTTFLCQADGKWNGSMPRCVAICSSPTIHANSRVLQNQTTYIFNDTIEVECYDGYKLKGQTKFICQNNGSWNGTMPTCIAICKPPVLEPHSRLLNNRSLYMYMYNDTIEIECDKGFAIEGQTQFTCQNDKQWNGIMPQCAAICEKPRIDNHSKVVSKPKDQYVEDDVIEIECDRGYATNDQTIFSCQTNGQWNGSMPRCLAICNSPNIYNNSRVLQNQTTYIFNDTIKIECDEGYKIEGQTQFICQNNGSWNGTMPTCIAMCKPPVLEPNSRLLNNRSEYIYNDTIEIECDRGFAIEGQTKFTCQKNKNWDGTMPMCKAICNSPSIHNNSRVLQNQTTYIYNDTIEVECDEGYKIEGQTQFICQNNGSWNGTMPTCIGENCEEVYCLNGGIVVLEETDKYCQCPFGWCGKRCETDINECSRTDLCINNGTCVNRFGTFLCKCEHGWRGERCEIDYNECSHNPCIHGICENFQGGFTCHCDSGWVGAYCGVDVNECLMEPCMNNATCKNSPGSFGCSCIDGFSGYRCETDINECVTFNISCLNNGTCIDIVNGFSCSCELGFTGQFCEHDINECSSNPCQNRVCKDEIGGYSCECSEGWIGKHCEYDLDECLNSPCSNNATCINSVGNYSCACNNGFLGSHCEIDVNECESHPCLNNGSCLDLAGEYKCVCLHRYTGKQCDVIDFCSYHPCHHGVCKVENNDFFCQCHDGWTGMSCEDDIDECRSNPCGNEFTCLNIEGGYNCLSCHNIQCLHNGTCVIENNAPKCLCSVGWTGYNCSLADNCINHKCDENMYCLSSEDGYNCHLKNLCDEYPCRNNGLCFGNSTDYICKCSNGWLGINCTVYDYCNKMPCAIGSTCINTGNGSFACLCAGDKTGRTCAETLDWCTSSPCYSNARCQSMTFGYVCHCGNGWVGRRCQYDINECQWDSCPDHMQCFNTPGGFNCKNMNTIQIVNRVRRSLSLKYRWMAASIDDDRGLMNKVINKPVSGVFTKTKYEQLIKEELRLLQRICSHDTAKLNILKITVDVWKGKTIIKAEMYCGDSRVTAEQYWGPIIKGQT